MGRTNASNPVAIVMGGSFNPPTLAHTRLMAHAMGCVNAGAGIFVPSSDAYVARKMRKAREKSAPYSEETRLRMLQAAILDDAALSGMKRPVRISRAEFGDDGRGHTYQTLCRVRDENPGLEYCFLLGADKLKILPRWHEIKSLLANFRIAILSRDGVDVKNAIRREPVLNEFKSRFVIIPPMNDNAGLGGVSSTAARAAILAGDAAALSRLCAKSVIDIALELKHGAEN